MNNALIDLKNSNIIYEGDYIICDELIAPIIMQLNNKNYITLASCASHIDDLNNIGTQIYILFDDINSITNLPVGFELIDDMIRRKISLLDSNGKRKNKEELEKERDKYLIVLQNWANELPYIERKDDKNE